MNFKDLPIINWFFKKEEKEQYPTRFVNVVLSDVAKMKGIKDDYNKIIQIIEYGEVTKEYPFTKEMLDAILKTDPLPLYEENYNADEEFEFDAFEDLTTSKYVGRK